MRAVRLLVRQRGFAVDDESMRAVQIVKQCRQILDRGREIVWLLRAQCGSCHNEAQHHHERPDHVVSWQGLSSDLADDPARPGSNESESLLDVACLFSTVGHERIMTSQPHECLLPAMLDS